MGYFEACANPVRTDATGQRVIVPLRWFGPVYLLRNDAEVARIKRGYKWLPISTAVFAGIASVWFGLGVVVPMILVQLLWVYLLTRGLVVLDMKAADMPRVPRAEAVARSHAAMGTTMVWLTRAIAVAVTVLFLWGAWEFGGIEAWIGVPTILLLDGVFVFDIVQQRSYRKSQAAPRSA